MPPYGPGKKAKIIYSCQRSAEHRFYHDLYNYCNRICSSQALHVVRRSGYAKSVVISTFDDCDILDKPIHFTGNVYNNGEKNMRYQVYYNL